MLALLQRGRLRNEFLFTFWFVKKRGGSGIATLFQQLQLHSLISYPISLKSVGQPARQLATAGICFVEGKVSKRRGKRKVREKRGQGG
jgi:hypothetical protein